MSDNSLKNDIGVDIDKAAEDLWSIAETHLNMLLGDGLFREYSEEAYNWVRMIAELQIKMSMGDKSEKTKISISYAKAGQMAFICKVKARAGDVVASAVDSVFELIIGLASVVVEKALTAGMILLLGDIGEYLT